MTISRYEDWLLEYLHYTSGHETPTLYHKWVGLGLIASCLKQNVWIDMNTYNLYPNIFVVIVDTAGSGKSHAIENFGLRLLKYADEVEPDDDNKLYIYNQKISAPAMIKSMDKLYKDTGGHCVSVFAEELGFFTNLAGENTNISDLLIKTYDNGLQLANETIIRGFEGIPNPQLNIIGGTTPDSLKKSVAKEFITNGVVSRIMFIHSEELGESKPFPTPPKENKTRKTYLAYDLNEFKKLGGKEKDKGKFKWTQESIDYYEKWYRKTRDNYVIKKEVEKAKVFKRLANKMLKIAMILSVSRKHNLILELDDIIDAIKIRNEVLDNYLYISSKLTTSEFGEKVESLLSIIKINKKITHSNLLRKTHHYFGLNEFKNGIETLIEAELITIKMEYTKNATKPTKIYIWKG